MPMRWTPFGAMADRLFLLRHERHQESPSFRAGRMSTQTRESENESGRVMEMGILVLGLGNSLLMDEGVGIHLVRSLEPQLGGRSDVTLLDGGTLSFSLAGALAEHPALIILDAADIGGSPPGTVSCFEGDAMDNYLKGGRRSVHEVSLGDLLDITRLSDHLPVRRALVGVKPEKMEWGERLSPRVAAAMDEARGRVVELVEQWSREMA